MKSTTKIIKLAGSSSKPYYITGAQRNEASEKYEPTISHDMGKAYIFDNEDKARKFVNYMEAVGEFNPDCPPTIVDAKK